MSTPWLLLRGLMRETRHWGDFPAQLAAAGQTSTYTLDLAGNGLRYRETSGPTVPDMADDVADQWQRLRGGPVRVLALSLGGMVAAEWARQAPHTVTELVLCNSSFRPYSAPWERFQPRALSKLLRLLLTAPAALEIETEILRLSSNRPEAHAAQLCDWVQWRQQCPVSAGNVLRQLAAAARYRFVAAWWRERARPNSGSSRASSSGVAMRNGGSVGVGRLRRSCPRVALRLATTDTVRIVAMTASESGVGM